MSRPSPTPFGKYELLDRIAAGGMAEIFRARYEPAPGVTKQVVIKKILPHYAANRGFIAMFTNEARIAMGLSHGNIAQVFDFGAIDEDYFLAMELVDGQPLSKVLKRARTFGIPGLPPPMAAYIAIELLKGLHYAHTRLDPQGRPLHIVHRDVSAQNVLLSYEGEVKVVDFGIAKARNAGTEDTAAGAVKGKYTYFAPEQARGKELDARTDVFAAGIVLYEMLVGQPPFQGRMMDVLTRIVRGQFARPREVNRRVPSGLERIVLKAMALEKSDRYQTAEAFHQALSHELASSYPDFTPVLLTRFLQLLFEEELVAEGRPTKLPRDFIELAQTWKAPEPAPGDEESATEMIELGEADVGPGFPELPDFDERARRKRPWLRVALVGLAAAALGVGATLFALTPRAGTLQVSSAPPGASISIDGADTGLTTPARLEGLKGARTYRLRLDAEGRQPWANDVPLASGQHLLVDATLSPLPAPAPETPPEFEPTPETTPAVAPEPAPEPVAPAVVDEVRWPARRFALDAAHHRLDLSAAGALSVALEPATTYRVSLSKGPLDGWGFYVVNQAGAQPGAFTARPLQMRGATRLFAFHLPVDGPTDVAKPRRLTLEGNGRRRLTRTVPGTVAFPPSARLTVVGLDPSATYELTVRQGEPPARARTTGQEVRRVVAGHPTGGLVVVGLDEPWRFTAAGAIWLTLLTDSDDGQSGRLFVELREVVRRRRRR